MPSPRKTTLKWAALLGATMLCSSAMAERALIIANFAYDSAAPQTAMRKGAEDVSETLFGYADSFGNGRLGVSLRRQLVLGLLELAFRFGQLLRNLACLFSGRLVFVSDTIEQSLRLCPGPFSRLAKTLQLFSIGKRAAIRDSA